MKLFLSIVFTIILMMSFTACGTSNNNDSEGNINTESSIDPGPFTVGEYGEISVTPDWTVPESALFLDIRNDWERVEFRALGSVGGALYEYREQNGDGSERYINPNFYEDVLALADSEHREIILICHSGYRTAFAAKLLSDKGFSNVWHIVGGMNSWTQVKPSETLVNTPL